MSWISGLADKAENLLNKIDQNAATALHSPVNVDPRSRLLEEPDVIRRNLSASSLSLSRSLTPKKYVRSEPDRNVSSISSSRRSSVSSKLDPEPVTIDLGSVVNVADTKPEEYSVQRELAAFKIALADVTSERNELKDELALLQEEFKQSRSDVRIRELEALVTELSAERDELFHVSEEFKRTNDAYVASLSDLESTLGKTRQEYFDVSERLSLQMKETENHSSALDQYRKKAQSTLQMKDKIIKELKAGVSSEDNSNDNILKFEIESSNQEKAHLQEEVHRLIKEVDTLRQQMQLRDEEAKHKVQSSNNAEEKLRALLAAEQQRSIQLDTDLKILNQEISAVREHTNTQRQTLTARLREKETELAKARSQASQIVRAEDSSDFENRIKALTESLVQKQASMEAITADRNALRLQLEKTRDQLDAVVVQNNRPLRSQIINLNDTDDVKARLPELMRANPFDNRVARRVKRAYSTLDSAGIRLGVFLRRYPLIRILVFAYVALLHIWVMFVLLSTPGI